MTQAVTLWIVRSACAALWIVEHFTLAARARRRGVPRGLAWTIPALPCWRAGDRVGPGAWVGLAIVYAVASVLSSKLR
ncbi:MAG: hypothetical protein U0326_30410 [Polyangiales bacterium]